MTIELGWINVEETVITFNLRGKWGSEDFYEAIDNACEIVNKKSYPVYMIIDFSYSIAPPPNVMTLFRNSFKRLPQNVEQVIVISKSDFWPRVFFMLDEMHLLHFAVHHVDDANQAYDILGDNVSGTD